ncbi:arylsulfatase [Microbulbifer thermotolerans]|uniref:Arylsulfatase n=1 Tax=Microbulbifer thermotolerans TaxID=252514 RepID=A0A143HLM3_MICTH|nr:arylsulfatase [Microbulbifer thermotolerans]AMX02407.1 arylsulfatase [Microbulbifer thermotolerans]MCX2779942.1 arylsulfatase [Microbulbifer thermotolerans]MCX2781862.1 arylsulfatase [Microbulbifer thermotolerans]MCX2795202.1 arylsulfatase [Microbulbifer thermotolerans]MCX2805365.1 arylsulfatase [Microbulbifer thermotolerans]
MNRKRSQTVLLLSLLILIAAPGILTAQSKPNIVFIMGDDIGMWNISAYHRGLMAGRTPNIDQLANEGVLFTDYYAEASCTAGRANFITGQLPIRTGMTTVGQAGAKIGLPARAPTLATALKELGYATGQFGKNHLGDRNEFLPTVHGFDEFFGYLYHLDAMEDPFHPNYPKDLLNTVGPRNVLHTFATDKYDDTEDPRWGKVGRQKIIDKGPLPPHPMEGIEYNMETFDEVILQYTFNFMNKAQKENKPFFVWLNPTRMHVITHLSPKYKALRTPENNWSLQEAGMAQFDDIVGSVMKQLEQMGVADNTIIVVTTDNGAEGFTWPDGGTTPFKGWKGMATEGGFRVPCIARWPGKIKPNQVNNEIMSGLDWFPTFVAAAGYDGDIIEDLKKGKTLNGKKYKVHLDGYNQMDMLTKGSKSARNEIWYFTESSLAAVRIGDYKYTFLNQPQGWFGPKVPMDWPGIVNLRLDPFEKMGLNESLFAANWWAYEFWRFVFVQQQVEKLAKTAVEFPPMQPGASFNLTSVKRQIEKAISSRTGQ